MSYSDFTGLPMNEKIFFSVAIIIAGLMFLNMANAIWKLLNDKIVLVILVGVLAPIAYLKKDILFNTASGVKVPFTPEQMFLFALFAIIGYIFYSNMKALSPK